MISYLLISILSFSLVAVDLTPAREAVRDIFTEAMLLTKLEKINAAIHTAVSDTSLEKQVALNTFDLALDVAEGGLAGNVSNQVKHVLDQIRANIASLSLKAINTQRKNSIIFLLSGTVSGLIAYYLSKPSKQTENDENPTEEYIKSLQNRVALIGLTSILGGLSGLALFGAKTVNTWGMRFSLMYLEQYLESKGQ
jgi:hypothetical protein